MVRQIDADLYAEMQKPVWHPVMFVSLAWPGEVIRAHSNGGTIRWGGFDWQGVGDFGRVSSPVEAPGIAAQELTLELHGLPPEVVEEAYVPIRGRLGRIFIGATTEAGKGALVGTPYIVFTGYMDALGFSVQREGDAIDHYLTLSIAVGPSARSSSTVVHSAERQQQEYPGDTAGRFLVEIQKRVQTLTWPE